MSFPEDRFVRAGADTVTLTALGEEYDALPPAAQQTFSEQIATMSDQGVRDLLGQREERASEAAAAESQPAAPTGSSSTTPGAGSSGTSTPDSSGSTSK